MKQIIKDISQDTLSHGVQRYKTWDKYKRQVRNKKKFNEIKQTVIKNYLKNSNSRLRQWYASFCEELPIDEKLIVFESREGNGFVGNPYGFYKAMQQDDRFADYTFCWIYHENVDVENLKNNIEDFKQTIFVQRNTLEYAKVLATAKCLINNTVTQTLYRKREGQIFVSTWHGTPLKSLAYDSPYDPQNPFPIRNGMRNFLMADFLLGPNEHTSKVLLYAYKVDGLFDGKILQGGYPRNDLTFNTSKETVYNKLKKANIYLDENKPTIMYTPTWRGRFISDASVNIDQMKTEVALLREKISDQYNLLVKVHPVAYDKIHADESLDDILVPNWADANEVMVVTDLLITDYSSIFFDYMVTDKPILFYCWDDDMYSKNRKMYLDLSTLPGPILHTMVEVIEAIKNIDSISCQYKDKYKAMKQMLLSYDDGQVAKREIEAIFFGKEQQNNLEIISGNQTKKRLLFYVGELKNNIVWRRFVQLIKNIDFDLYDITLIASPNLSEEGWNNLRTICHYIRPMFRQGYPLFTVEETVDDLLIRQYGLDEDTLHIYPERAYKNESNRIFGNCHFDMAIDFAGDNFYWTRYILESNADEKIVFQQYNLKKQIATARKNKKWARVRSLQAMISVYQRYDKVISVAKHASANYSYCQDKLVDESFVALPLKEDPVSLDWPVYEQDAYSNMEEVDYQVIPKESGEHIVIPDIQNKSVYYRIPITKEDKIDAVMESHEEDGTYIKLIINNVYFGWDRIENYEVGFDAIISEEIVNKTAIITNNGSHVFYSLPYNTSPEVKRLGGGKWLSGVAVTIDKEVVTSRATYCHTLIDGQSIGYIDKRGLKYTPMTPWLIRENHKRNDEKIEKRILSSESIENNSFTFNNRDITLWKKPYGSFGSEPSDLTVSDLSPVGLKLQWMMETSDGISYEIIDDYGQKAWVCAEDINLNL